MLEPSHQPTQRDPLQANSLKARPDLMSCLVTCAERSTVLNQAGLQAKHTA